MGDCRHDVKIRPLRAELDYLLLTNHNSIKIKTCAFFHLIEFDSRNDTHEWAILCYFLHFTLSLE